MGWGKLGGGTWKRGGRGNFNWGVKAKTNKKEMDHIKVCIGLKAEKCFFTLIII